MAEPLIIEVPQVIAKHTFATMTLVPEPEGFGDILTDDAKAWCADNLVAPYRTYLETRVISVRIDVYVQTPRIEFGNERDGVAFRIRYG